MYAPPLTSPDPAAAAGVKRKFWIAWIAACTVLIGGGAVLVLAALYFAKGHCAPSGGWYFFSRHEIPVPQFFQADPRWADDDLGPTENSLGAEGCAVSAAAMVLASYGIDTDPGRLNAALKKNGGFTPQGWLYWEKASELTPDKVRHVYEDDASHYLIDSNLRRGNPVIVRLKYPNGITHFVVICGKEGFDYLIRDPGGAGKRGVYPLREFGSDIQALRYYEKKS